MNVLLECIDKFVNFSILVLNREQIKLIITCAKFNQDNTVVSHLHASAILINTIHLKYFSKNIF